METRGSSGVKGRRTWEAGRVMGNEKGSSRDAIQEGKGGKQFGGEWMEHDEAG